MVVDVVVAPPALDDVVLEVVVDVLPVLSVAFDDLAFLPVGAVVGVVVVDPEAGSRFCAAVSAEDIASMSDWYPARFCAFSAVSAFW